MRCKEVHQQIIDGKDTKEIKLHTEACQNCADFLSEVQRIRQALAEQPFPEADAALIRATQRACHQELKRAQNRIRTKFFTTLPTGILAALAAITILTFVWIFIIFYSSQTTVQPGWQVWILFVLISQNIISLIMSPVLFKRTEWPMKAY